MQPNNSLKIPGNFLNTQVLSRPKLSPIQYVFLFFIRIFIQLKRFFGYHIPSIKHSTIKTINDQYFDKEYVRFLRMYEGFAKPKAEQNLDSFPYATKGCSVEDPKGPLTRISKADSEKNENQLSVQEGMIEEHMNNNVFNKNTDKEFYDIKKYEYMMVFEDNDIEIKWRTRILIENTPRGNIMMYYNSFKRGFAYYSDQQGVPYVILNTMAMKYVRVFQCLDLFMDDKVTPPNYPSPFIQIYKDEEKNALTSKIEETPVENRIDRDLLKSGPFAKLKKYNMITEPEKTVSTVSGTEQNKIKSEDTKSLKSSLIENNINRFLYMGKLTNSSLLQRTPINKMVITKNNQYDYMFEGEHDLQKEVLSYSEFKKKLTQSV